MRAAFRWIASNIPVMLLSLMLAVLAWVVAVEAEDPTGQERYPQPIPIELTDLPAGMVIVGDFDERAQVTILAPESVRNSLKVEDFGASVELAGRGAGTHTLPVQVSLNKEPSRVVAVEPEAVTLEVEPEGKQTVPVRVEVEGEPALGYLMRTPIVDSRQVTVTGPSSYVARAVEAHAVISVQDASADVERELPLQLQDSEGRAVPYVTWAPEKVTVSIPVEPSGYYRALAVKVVLEGTVAPGYYNSSISVEPPTVTVFGVPNVVSALPGFIETEPIDVEGAQADVIARPVLSVPENVTAVPGQRPVEVRVSIEAIQSSMTVAVAPELQGLGPSFTATVSPETVEVILSGPLPLLESLEADDVRVVLNLFGLPIGTHQIEPQVVVPEGTTAQSILPATVQVEILIASTSGGTGQ
jgi:YbbR domain-containing protein